MLAVLPPPVPPPAIPPTMHPTDTLTDRITLALEDYELSAERGHVRTDSDVLDIAARWTTTDFDAPVDNAEAWADFDALRVAVCDLHRERQAAG